MYLEQSGQEYYENIPRISEFDLLADPVRYVPLPDDWVVGVADIVGSTNHIENGRYKVVNMIAAAVISAQLNSVRQRRLPYVFGGDGAGFAVWPDQRAASERALQSVRSWARREFSVELRIAMISVREIRKSGRDLRVARYAPSRGVDYAMFLGGGLQWAEARMKAGLLALPNVKDALVPDLTGLSCRWSNMRARHGAILSLVVQPLSGVSEQAFAQVAHDVLDAAKEIPRAGHPVPRHGPGIEFPPPGVRIEARVRQKGALWLRKLKLLAQNAFIWGLFQSGVGFGAFDPKVYRDEISKNADFCKFDDGLKMTLDCDGVTQARIEKVLRKAVKSGLIRYGLHVQDEAMMTCLVPSAAENTHMHFVDGAAGGYASAAAQLS